MRHGAFYLSYPVFTGDEFAEHRPFLGRDGARFKESILADPLPPAVRSHKTVFETCFRGVKPDGVAMSMLNVVIRPSLVVESKEELCVAALNQAAEVLPWASVIWTNTLHLASKSNGQYTKAIQV